MEQPRLPRSDSTVIPIRPQVLVVDDRPDNHRALEHTLAAMKVDIVHAYSGQEAVSLSLRTQFAVILMDVMMPQMDGFEAAELIRLNDETRLTPIIFLTAADPNSELEDRGYQLGAVDYICKPVREPILQAKLQVFLELANHRHLIYQQLTDLERLEKRNQLLLKSIGEGILGLSTDGQVTFSNPVAQQTLGMSEQELEGRSFSDIVYHGDAEQPLVTWEYLPARLACEQGQAYHERIGVFWDRAGQLLPVEYKATPMMVDDDLAGIVIAFQDITERRRTEEQLARLAQYDALTGLVNRNAFNGLLKKALSRSARHEQPLALLFIDLDQFKTINDNHGHEIGDSLLQEVAMRLTDCVRNGDIIGRLGGDEFVIMLESLQATKDAARVSQSVLDALEAPFTIRGHQIFIGASIGIAVYPDSALTARELLRCADIAMYRSKEEGRNRYRFFTDEMQESVREALQLEIDLRRAYRQQEFDIYLQPKICMATESVIGAEILIRWPRPDGSFLPPDVFIPKAEEMGLIHDIGEWVFRETCDTIRSWQQQNRIPLDFTFAINISMRQLHTGHLAEDIAAIVKEVGIDPNCLEVEVTESIMMQDPRVTIDALNALHQQKIKISIDDFGTGYSSLSHLRQLPIDAIKIDKSFVQALESDGQADAIVNTIISLGHNLDMRVIAEGIETEANRQALTAAGCDVAQGYFYAKPMCREDFLDYLDRYSASSSHSSD
ncbi:EAL domain-containing protein [Reinekea blandensis]|uniref:cyclic-guanylate-specific phosphodiesterase n=1 Tax=Reinekea blandensis MED297 TaxID=314283 RepID=A4BCU3_9GAMM|nr:EAL domain-containing protein [Reinekea blandensis]EAR10025.1 response regulator/sensory box/GGDEF domain/EAL domain protein [Reinekea sp. MED297] [Reinekea blandensis MED297]